jgi:hypothetical protein
MEEQEPSPVIRRKAWLVAPFACLPPVAIVAEIAGATFIVPVYFLIAFAPFIQACRNSARAGELWWLLLLSWIAWGLVMVAVMIVAYWLFGWEYSPSAP